jgi:HAD superfamily hydrolase (TIGR01509 family)
MKMRGASDGPFELVIFDCDGVLIDSEVISCRTDIACLAEIGIAISIDEVMDRYVGISAAAMVADLEARSGRLVPPNFTETLRHRVASAFDAELRAIPGIEAALDLLPCRSCVASSSMPERLRHSLSLVGLFDRFHPHIFSATEVARGKPAPDLFLHAAARMAVAPVRCLVVEDSVPGVQAARAAGMPVLGFTGGGHCRPGHGDRLGAAGAASVLADMAQLGEAIAALTAASASL